MFSRLLAAVLGGGQHSSLEDLGKLECWSCPRVSGYFTSLSRLCGTIRCCLDIAKGYLTWKQVNSLELKAPDPFPSLQYTEMIEGLMSQALQPTAGSSAIFD